MRSNGPSRSTRRHTPNASRSSPARQSGAVASSRWRPARSWRRCEGDMRRKPKQSILVVHGPNLNLLGTRETDVYGSQTLADIDAALEDLGDELGVALDTFQSNSEGEIVSTLQQARGLHDGV